MASGADTWWQQVNQQYQQQKKDYGYATQMYTGQTPPTLFQTAWNSPNAQYANAFQAFIKGLGQPGTPQTTAPDAAAVQQGVANASQNFNAQTILDSLLNNQDVSVTTPGGNTLTGSGSGRTSSGGAAAGSATLAKELQQKLQVMNLDQQNQLLQLQTQQDPQLYALQQQKIQNEYAKIAGQQTYTQQNYANQLWNLNSGAAATGAFTSQGNNQARGALGQQLQYQLGNLNLAKSNVDVASQTGALNEAYNKAALASQTTMNFWERFA